MLGLLLPSLKLCSRAAQFGCMELLTFMHRLPTYVARGMICTYVAVLMPNLGSAGYDLNLAMNLCTMCVLTLTTYIAVLVSLLLCLAGLSFSWPA